MPPNEKPDHRRFPARAKDTTTTTRATATTEATLGLAGAAGFRPSLPLQALEVVGVVVDEGHQLGDEWVTRLLGDEAVHLLAHSTVGRVPRGLGAELEHVHRRAGVELDRVAQ